MARRLNAWFDRNYRLIFLALFSLFVVLSAWGQWRLQQTIDDVRAEAQTRTAENRATIQREARLFARSYTLGCEQGPKSTRAAVRKAFDDIADYLDGITTDPRTRRFTHDLRVIVATQVADIDCIYPPTSTTTTTEKP